jgi:hypothetical protein
MRSGRARALGHELARPRGGSAIRQADGGGHQVEPDGLFLAAKSAHNVRSTGASGGVDSPHLRYISPIDTPQYEKKEVC